MSSSSSPILRPCSDQLADDAHVIPGHGPLSSKDELRAYHRMLVETTDIVRQRIAAEQSLEQITQAGFPDEWKDWQAGMVSAERWIAIIHRSLTRH